MTKRSKRPLRMSGAEALELIRGAGGFIVLQRPGGVEHRLPDSGGNILRKLVRALIKRGELVAGAPGLLEGCPQTYRPAAYGEPR